MTENLLGRTEIRRFVDAHREMLRKTGFANIATGLEAVVVDAANGRPWTTDDGRVIHMHVGPTDWRFWETLAHELFHAALPGFEDAYTEGAACWFAEVFCRSQRKPSPSADRWRSIPSSGRDDLLYGGCLRLFDDLSKEFPDNVASLFRSGIDVSRKAANGIWNSFQVCDVECWLSSLQPSARTQAEKLLERHRLRLQPYLQGNVSLTDWPDGSG